MTELLSGKEKDFFLEYTNAWAEVLGISTCETFVDGFRIGSAFTLDTFVNTDNEFTNIK